MPVNYRQWLIEKRADLVTAMLLVLATGEDTVAVVEELEEIEAELQGCGFEPVDLEIPF